MSYLATVARETGWGYDFIVWKLPYAVGLGIMHAAAGFHGSPQEYLDGDAPGAGPGPVAAVEAVAADLAVVRARYGELKRLKS